MLEQIELRNKILDENQKSHDYFAENYDRCCSYIARKPCRNFYANLIKRQLKLSSRNMSDLRVLEIGCGTGTWTYLFPGVKRFVGVDISPGMVLRAQTKYPEATFICTDVKSFLEQEIAAGNTYDIILSSSFLHHLYDIDEILDLINQVLTGTYLAIHEPMKPLDNSFHTFALGNQINGRLALLFGYDNDLKANPLAKRLVAVGKSLIPFKRQIKRLLGRRRTSEEKNYVDYKLSKDQLFHPSMLANRVYPSLKVSFDLYSYYTFPFLRYVVGETLDYFYIKFDKI
jgi:SAM-dependent methyltransferase